MSSQKAAVAVTRFGMGAQMGEIQEINGDGRGWLEAQLNAADLALIRAPNLTSSEEIVARFVEFRKEQRGMRRADGEDAQKARRSLRRSLVAGLVGDITARNTHATQTKHGFLERWVRFWGNHFTVSSRKFETIGLVGPFEREAVRPNAFGRFSDLLKTSALHAGMLLYLDNHRSIGPSTRVAKRRKVGLNENLAREILELHTLGVDGGYTQEDVVAFAKALTGWTIAAPPLRSSGFGKVVFEPRIHEPGSQTVLGKRYGQDDADQAASILNDLARHPSTARHIATKLARHFVSDTPPESAVQKLEAVFRDTEGNLTELARAVIHLDEAWSGDAQKLKTPEELLISAARALGGFAVFGGGRDLRKIYESLGQPPYGAPAPEGWPDKAEDWAGPDAIKKRLEWANRAGQRGQSRMGAEAFLEGALGPLASQNTRLWISRAESNAQALTLALMSPEFQRR